MLNAHKARNTYTKQDYPTSLTAMARTHDPHSSSHRGRAPHDTPTHAPHAHSTPFLHTLRCQCDNEQGILSSFWQDIPPSAGRWAPRTGVGTYYVPETRPITWSADNTSRMWYSHQLMVACRPTIGFRKKRPLPVKGSRSTKHSKVEARP